MADVGSCHIDCRDVCGVRCRDLPLQEAQAMSGDLSFCPLSCIPIQMTCRICHHDELRRAPRAS